MTKVLDVVLIRKTARGNPRDGGALTVKVAFRDERNTLTATCGDVVLAAIWRNLFPRVPTQFACNNCILRGDCREVPDSHKVLIAAFSTVESDQTREPGSVRWARPNSHTPDTSRVWGT